MSNSNEPNTVSDKPDSSSPAETKPRGRAFERILFVVGFSLIAIFAYKSFHHYSNTSLERAITGKIMPGLENADRIPLKSGDATGYNLIIITMDTTRADHLECYGNRAVKTPNINSLAKNGVLFANSFTPAPSTLPSHSSIMTGLYPYHHGARANGSFKLGPENITLAETLKDHGYSTGAVISAYVLDSRFGLDQGFEQYNDDLTKGVRWGPHMFRERPGDYTNEAAFEWLDEHVAQTTEDQKKKPFFMWIHYFDAHAPYLPREPYRTKYKTHLYDGEIAFVDEVIGDLLEKLGALGIRENTIIVLAGDHGEGLGEHGEMSHSLLTYDATLHTPLIISSPKLLSAGHVVKNEVSNVDIVPTVLDLLGIKSTVKYDGVSLLQGKETWPKGIYFETISTLVLHGWAPVFGIRQNDAKYIHAPKPELYDLTKDPKELNNILDQKPNQVVAMSKELEEHIGDDPYFKNAPIQLEAMDPDVAKKLAALGYVGTKSTSEMDLVAAQQFNPKDMVPHFEKVNKANNQISSGKFSQGIATLEECIKEVPNDVWALRTLGSAYIVRGQIDKAEACTRRALEIEKGDAGLYTTLGRIYIRKRDFSQAKEFLDQALKIDPDDAEIWDAFGSLAAAQNDRKKAEEYFLKAIKIDPGSTGPTVYAELGWMYQQSLEFDKAREAFEKAIELDKLNASAHCGLGSLLVEENKLDEAMNEFKIALRFNPNSPINLASLASLYDKKHNFDQAKALAERALGVNPTFRPALNNLGLIMKHTGNLDKAMELFNRVLEKQPGYLATRINLAQCYLSRKEVEKAVDQFRKVLQHNPNTPVALANMGVYHVTHGRPKEAMRFFTQALRVKPDYALVHAHVGMLLLRQGNQAAALIHLKKSLEIDPNQQGHEQLEYQVSLLEQAGTATSQPVEESQVGSETH